MKLKLTKVFYQIRKAIHKACHLCEGTGIGENGKCEFCHGSGKEYKYIKLQGSSRSSKTRSTIQNIYSEAWNNSGLRISVWRDTKKDCKDTVGKDMDVIFPTMPYYSPSTVNLHKTDSIYTFPSKSTIELCGTDEVKKVHGFNGHIAWLNEPYQIPEDVFNQIDQRTELYVIIDLNPKENHWSDKLDKHPRCITLHSTYKDNQYCPPEQKAKIESYQTIKQCSLVVEKIISEADVRKYDIAKNPLKFSELHIKELYRCSENERIGTANEYNWSVYGLGEKSEKPNRIFKWTPIPDHEYHALDLKKYYGVDWGSVDPWGIIEAKYYDGNLYLHELNYTSENEIRRNLTSTELLQIAEGEGLVTWMFQKLNIPKNKYIICDNNRRMKVFALQAAGWDYAIEAYKPPGSINDGIDLLNGLKVFYTASSKNIEYEQENYERDVDKFGVVMDEPIDANNHLIDPTRYVAAFLKLEGIIKSL